MTPKEAAAKLSETMTQDAIAEKVESTQATISKILNNPEHQPFWPLGDALIRLAKKTRRKAK